MATKKPMYTVGNADVEASYNESGPALSRSITIATRSDSPTTVYVRDPDGNAIGYSERDADGNIETRRY